MNSVNMTLLVICLVSDSNSFKARWVYFSSECVGAFHFGRETQKAVFFFMPEHVGWEFDHIRTGQKGETEQEIWLPYKPEG